MEKQRNWRAGLWLVMAAVGFILFGDDKSYLMRLYATILLLYFQKYVSRQ